MRNGDETVIGRGHPQHDVGEGEIGEQLPVADEQVQPLDVGLARSPLGLDEITEGRHASRLVAGRPRADEHLAPLIHGNHSGQDARTRLDGSRLE